MVDLEQYKSQWEDKWASGLEPGQAFDATRSSPALDDLLQSGSLPVEGKRVIVPGCGRGYDLTTFLRNGNAAQVVGLEISSTAVAAATKYLAETSGLVPVDAASKIPVLLGDFFHFDVATVGGPFDIGYDYTFFCAMHPTARADWAVAWSKLLTRGGKLVTLMFPLDPSFTQGPPWAVTPEDYSEVLEGAGLFRLVQSNPVPVERSHKGRGGKEAIAIWERL